MHTYFGPFWTLAGINSGHSAPDGADHFCQLPVTEQVILLNMEALQQEAYSCPTPNGCSLVCQ